MNIKEVKINNTIYLLRAITPNPDDCYIELEAFCCYGEVTSEDGIEYDPPKKYFSKKESTASDDVTCNLEEARRVFKAEIKWDGCSHIDFYPDRKGYEHFCGKRDATDLGLVLNEAYDFAAELMGDKVDKYCFYD
jgi:hypothetical protein